jgi:hypothetical protein
MMNKKQTYLLKSKLFFKITYGILFYILLHDISTLFIHELKERKERMYRD